MTPMRSLAFLLIALACPGSDEETARWRLQYFFDEDRSEFAISDLKFPSPQRGIAVGAVVRSGPSGEASIKPMSAITNDGGAHWSLVPLKEPGMSLFFVNDSLGWLVTTRGLWRTEEAGRSWRKLKAPEGIARVHFLDADRGFAVCSRKRVYETKDGGENWVKLAFPDEIKSNPDNTHFAWIEFANPQVGMLGGWSRPPRRTNQRLPDWVDAEKAKARAAWPQLSILADTHDGGKTWKPGAASLFGQITGARLSTDGWGLGLIEFADTFEVPSEVVFLNWKTGNQRSSYRDKSRRVTDIAIAAPKGPAYLGAVEHFGDLQQLPVPRKVVILRTLDAASWTEMPVDYRATARRVILATAGAGEMWLATDTGMILKLTP